MSKKIKEGSIVKFRLMNGEVTERPWAIVKTILPDNKLEVEINNHLVGNLYKLGDLIVITEEEVKDIFIEQ